MTTTAPDLTSRAKEYCVEAAKHIDCEIEQLLICATPAMTELFQAAQYSCLNGGKRIRPVLTLVTSECLGVSLSTAIHPACAVELIHAYSLIHDDLPCMDDDDFRRGQPTLHKKYSESTALLVGDYLLTYAFEVLGQAPGLNTEQRLRLVQELAKGSGAAGLVGGQFIDIISEGKKVSLAELQQIHAHKTGALIRTAVRFGGILADASESVLEALDTYGNAIGLAFQITDDIIDVTHSKEKHGCETSSDESRGKVTYVSLLGLDKARSAANSEYQRAITALDAIPGDTDLLAGLAELIVSRTS